MEAHQQRVVDEKSELADKHEKLKVFIDESPIYAGLPDAEKKRLVRQSLYMALYSNVLDERIDAFLS